MKALVIGCGIGGLATALWLHERGIGCQLFEQSALQFSPAPLTVPLPTTVTDSGVVAGTVSLSVLVTATSDGLSPL